MDDAARMREVDSEAHTTERGEELVTRELGVDGFEAIHATEMTEHRLERETAHALHREERAPRDVLGEIVDRNDRRMLELALHACFAEEARARLTRRVAAGQRHLQGDIAPDPAVVAQEDL